MIESKPVMITFKANLPFFFIDMSIATNKSTEKYVIDSNEALEFKLGLY